MKTYIFKSKKFSGLMVFKYKKGILTSFENYAELKPEHIMWFGENFPMLYEMLEQFNKGAGRVEELKDLSFDNFWDVYDYKKDKQQAESYWKKMPEEDKYKAIANAPDYKRKCKHDAVSQVYAIRYLKYRRFEDE